MIGFPLALLLVLLSHSVLSFPISRNACCSSYSDSFLSSEATNRKSLRKSSALHLLDFFGKLKDEVGERSSEKSESAQQEQDFQDGAYGVYYADEKIM